MSTKSLCLSRKICMLSLYFYILNKAMYRLDREGAPFRVVPLFCFLSSRLQILLLSSLYLLYFSFAFLQRFLRFSSRTSLLISAMSLSFSFRMASISSSKFSSAALNLRYSYATFLGIKLSKRLKELSNLLSSCAELIELRLTLVDK